MYCMFHQLISMYECPTTKSVQMFMLDMTLESCQWFADKAKKWYKSEGFKTSVDDNDDAFVYKSYFICFGCIKVIKIASLKQ